VTKRIRIQWTDTARECLRSIPRKAAQGLINKADQLTRCDDPTVAHKALTGPLQGYFRITYSRYRAIYRVDEEKLKSGDVLVTVIVRFVVAGIRKEGDKHDVYRLAQKILEYGGFGDAEAVDERREPPA